MRFFEKDKETPIDETFINLMPFKFFLDIIVKHGFYDEYIRKYGHPLKQANEREDLWFSLIYLTLLFIN